MGPWLGYDFDWRRRHLYRSEWHEGWDFRRGHDREVFIDSHVREAQVWRVDPKRRQIELRHPAVQRVAAGTGKVSVPYPKPLVIAPRKGESIRRAEVKIPGTLPEVIKEPKGHAMTPKTGAPGIPGEAGRARLPSGAEIKAAPAVREAAPNLAPKVYEAAPKTHADVKKKEDKKDKKEP